MNTNLTTKTLRNLAFATLIVWAFANEADAQEVDHVDHNSAVSTKLSGVDLYGY